MNTMIQREVRRIMRSKRTDVDATEKLRKIEAQAQSQKARVIEVQAKVNRVLDDYEEHAEGLDKALRLDGVGVGGGGGELPDMVRARRGNEAEAEQAQRVIEARLGELGELEAMLGVAELASQQEGRALQTEEFEMGDGAEWGESEAMVKHALTAVHAVMGKVQATARGVLTNVRQQLKEDQAEIRLLQTTVDGKEGQIAGLQSAAVALEREAREAVAMKKQFETRFLEIRDDRDRIKTEAAEERETTMAAMAHAEEKAAKEKAVAREREFEIEQQQQKLEREHAAVQGQLEQARGELQTAVKAAAELRETLKELEERCRSMMAAAATAEREKKEMGDAHAVELGELKEEAERDMKVAIGRLHQRYAGEMEIMKKKHDEVLYEQTSKAEAKAIRVKAEHEEKVEGLTGRLEASEKEAAGAKAEAEALSAQLRDIEETNAAKLEAVRVECAAQLEAVRVECAAQLQEAEARTAEVVANAVGEATEAARVETEARVEATRRDLTAEREVALGELRFTLEAEQRSATQKLAAEHEERMRAQGEELAATITTLRDEASGHKAKLIATEKELGAASEAKDAAIAEAETAAAEAKTAAAEAAELREQKAAAEEALGAVQEELRATAELLAAAEAKMADLDDWGKKREIEMQQTIDHLETEIAELRRVEKRLRAEIQALDVDLQELTKAAQPANPADRRISMRDLRKSTELKNLKGELEAEAKRQAEASERARKQAEATELRLLEKQQRLEQLAEEAELEAGRVAEAAMVRESQREEAKMKEAMRAAEAQVAEKARLEAEAAAAVTLAEEERVRQKEALQKELEDARVAAAAAMRESQREAEGALQAMREAKAKVEADAIEKQREMEEAAEAAALAAEQAEIIKKATKGGSMMTSSTQSGQIKTLEEVFCEVDTELRETTKALEAARSSTDEGHKRELILKAKIKDVKTAFRRTRDTLKATEAELKEMKREKGGGASQHYKFQRTLRLGAGPEHHAANGFQEKARRVSVMREAAAGGADAAELERLRLELEAVDEASQSMTGIKRETQGAGSRWAEEYKRMQANRRGGAHDRAGESDMGEGGLHIGGAALYRGGGGGGGTMVDEAEVAAMYQHIEELRETLHGYEEGGMLFAAMVQELQCVPAIDLLRRELRDVEVPSVIDAHAGDGGAGDGGAGDGSGKVGGVSSSSSMELYEKLQNIRVRCLPALTRARHHFARVKHKWDHERQRLLAQRPSDLSTGRECPLCFADRRAKQMHDEEEVAATVRFHSSIRGHASSPVGVRAEASQSPHHHGGKKARRTPTDPTHLASPSPEVEEGAGVVSGGAARAVGAPHGNNRRNNGNENNGNGGGNDDDDDASSVDSLDAEIHALSSAALAVPPGSVSSNAMVVPLLQSNVAKRITAAGASGGAVVAVAAKERTLAQLTTGWRKQKQVKMAAPKMRRPALGASMGRATVKAQPAVAAGPEVALSLAGEDVPGNVRRNVHGGDGSPKGLVSAAKRLRELDSEGRGRGRNSPGVVMEDVAPTSDGDSGGAVTFPGMGLGGQRGGAGEGLSLSSSTGGIGVVGDEYRDAAEVAGRRLSPPHRRGRRGEGGGVADFEIHGEGSGGGGGAKDDTSGPPRRRERRAAGERRRDRDRDRDRDRGGSTKFPDLTPPRLPNLLPVPSMSPSPAPLGGGKSGKSGRRGKGKGGKDARRRGQEQRAYDDRSDMRHTESTTPPRRRPPPHPKGKKLATDGKDGNHYGLDRLQPATFKGTKKKWSTTSEEVLGARSGSIVRPWTEPDQDPEAMAPQAPMGVAGSTQVGVGDEGGGYSYGDGSW
jgi:hypothetical protein